jgi:hypothetical protein
MNLANRLQARGYDSQAIKHLELARAIRPSSKENSRAINQPLQTYRQNGTGR